MWLHHCINKKTAGRRISRAAAAVVLSVVLVACGGTGTTKPDRRSDGVPAGVAGAEFGAEIPPEAQTLYEQAVAVMASGDYLDAELRLKELMLQYPGYPGAYVNLAILRRPTRDAGSQG